MLQAHLNACSLWYIMCLKDIHVCGYVCMAIKYPYLAQVRVKPVQNVLYILDDANCYE
jgi:hypothetical protein